MIHPDLGQRATLCDCPTRVNPEIKKAYARTDSGNTPKKTIEKCNNYSVAELSRQLGIEAKAFHYRAKKLTGKIISNLYNDEIMMVFNDIKLHPIRRAMKRRKK